MFVLLFKLFKIKTKIMEYFNLKLKATDGGKMNNKYLEKKFFF